MHWALIALAVTACGDNLHATCAPCPSDPGACEGPDAAPPPPSCDDGNPCTKDSVVGGMCRFDALPDGTPCDDGDLCTLGDRCQSGTCVAGPRASGELAILGSLDNLSGRRVPLGPGRFVVVTSESLFRGRIKVVSATRSGVATLSSWEGELTLIVTGDDDLLADAIESTGIVAVAAVSDRTLRLFSASDAAVVPRGALELTNQILSFAGHGNRLWLCGGNFLVGYQVTLVDLADPDAPVEVGSMPLGPTACGSVAVSDSGHHVYVNTAGGVRYIDATPLDTGGTPTLSDVISPPAGVNISGSDLLLMTATAVRVLNEPDLSEVISVPVAHARAATLFGDRLLVEGNRAVGGDSEVYIGWYDTSGPTLLAEAVTRTFLGPPGGSTFRSASDGATLLTATRAFDLTRDRLDELRIPALLPMRSLGRTAVNGVRVYDPSGAAAIDLDDITVPRFMSGGAFHEARPVLTVAIDDSLPAPILVSGLGGGFEDSTRALLDPTNPYLASPLSVSRWTLDRSAELSGEQTFAITYQGTSQLLTAGDFIYRSFRPSSANLASGFTGYWLPGIGSGGAVPVFDLPLTAATTARRGFDVDPRARVAVVSAEVPAASGLAPALVFYDLSTSPPTQRDQIATDGLYLQLRISGDRVAAVGSEDAIVFFERGVGEVSRVASPNAFETQLLAFDGTVAYFGQLVIVPGTATYELVAATFGDSGPPVFVEVTGIARALTAVDGGLALGFDTELLTVHPQCR